MIIRVSTFCCFLMSQHGFAVKANVILLIVSRVSDASADPMEQSHFTILAQLSFNYGTEKCCTRWTV